MSFQDIVNYIEHRNRRNAGQDDFKAWVSDAISQNMTNSEARLLMQYLGDGHHKQAAEMLRDFLIKEYAGIAEQHARQVRADEWYANDQARRDNEVLARAAS